MSASFPSTREALSSIKDGATAVALYMEISTKNPANSYSKKLLQFITSLLFVLCQSMHITIPYSQLSQIRCPIHDWHWKWLHKGLRGIPLYRGQRPACLLQYDTKSTREAHSVRDPEMHTQSKSNWLKDPWRGTTLLVFSQKQEQHTKLYL